MDALPLFSPVRIAPLLCGLILWFLSCHPSGRHVVADERQVEADLSELSDDEIRQVKTAERFFSILEKNPRLGTALDRVYGHHVEFGTLNSFLETLKSRAAAQNNNGALWMLLGMFESQRGNDAAAVDALLRADELRSEDALSSYYLGQAQLRVGQSSEAVASFERAISRKPARADLLEIFQTLGRVHQRAQRTEDAMKVWQRLESLFPDDPRVLEQIAVTLAEEGQPAAALSRYQKLAGLVRDDYRKVVYQVAAAELTIKTGQRDAGIEALEQVLADLNPESWLYRDVRRRIEEVFLRSGDQDSLVSYYQRWIEEHPDDIEGMTRLARFLASSARVPEATDWMEKALKLAPSRTDLRKAFIDQLVDDQRYSEAIRQYELLAAAAPGNPDFLREWGKLVLRNKEVPESERRQEAVRIWNQILETRPDDALTTSQVADLLRQNKLNERAEQLYRRAIELAPADPQYREYLGEFLHIQKRSDEALIVWSGIAEGDRRNAANITRLAEVYNSFGFSDKAIIEIAEAVSMDPGDFSLQIRSADYHMKAAKFDEALAFVNAADMLASNDDERDAVIQQRIEVLQASQRLDSVADELLATLKRKGDATRNDWYTVARYLEAARRWADANEAIDNAIAIDSRSIPSMTVAARIAEASGDYGRASQMNRTLSEVDRRSRGDHLMNVSRLEAQMGRTEEALKAARELIVSAPGNTDNYEFYAQTCFRLGRADEGLEALRKAVRINPGEPHLIMSLGAALAEQLRTDEAIEVYWRAFDKSEEVEDKVGLSMKLTPLYQQINQLEKLIERFERDRREEDKRREMTICLAQAWHTAGDISAARQELESLLSEDTRDTNLLNQLAKLCQDGADLEAAISYQRQLVAIAPGHETEFPLAGMLMTNGQVDAAREIFVKLTQSEEDPVRQIRALDSLISQGNYESAIGVIEPLLAQNRDDWELLYREAVSWALLERTDEAINRFKRILALNQPYDSLGRSAEAKLKQAQAKAKSDNLRGITTSVPQKQSPLAMRGMASEVQMATGLTANNRYYGSNSPPPIWTPEAYGVARMAAFGWLIRYEDEAADSARSSRANAEAPTKETHDANPSIVESIHARANAENATRQAIYDSLYVAQLKNDYLRVFNIARRLAKAGGVEEQQFFLTSLNLRNLDANQAGRGSSNALNATKVALSDDDLQLLRDCYEGLSQENKSIDLSSMYGSNVAYGSNGQVYILIGGNYVQLAGVFRGEGGYLNTLVEELRLAGKTDEALKLLNERLRSASSAIELGASLALLIQEERFEELPEYFDRWHAAALEQIAAAPVVTPSRRQTQSPSNTASANVLQATTNTIQQWMGHLGTEEEHKQILSILERCLDVAEAEAKHRRLVEATMSGRTRSNSLAAPSTHRVVVYTGKEQTSANLTFPPPSTWMSNADCSLLYQAYESFRKNDISTDMIEMLRKRAALNESKPVDPDRQICRHMHLSAVLWWAEEQDEAVDLMASVAEMSPENLSLQFNLANMYQSRGDFEDALIIIDRIRPRDQKVLQQKELDALALAERLGDTDRARSAAERLFGLRLDAQTQLGLVDRMRRLGLSAMADAVLARAERTATNQTSSLASLMMLYQGQGKTEQASQLAHLLLRKTPSPVSLNNRSGRNPTRYRTSDSNFRALALQFLHRSGGLNVLIEQLEAQLERSPESILPMQQLIEFYEVSGQSDKGLSLLAKGIELRPDSPVLRLHFARQLEKSGKHGEACDQYLELIKIQPNWVTEDLYQIDRVFSQAKRKVDLVKSLSEINMKQIQEPWYIINTASNLLQDESSLDAGLTLLERTFEAFPNYRRNMLDSFRNEAIWKNDRVYEFAKQVVLPSAADIQSNPWTGLDQINSYSSNGHVDVFFHQMLNGLKKTDKVADLQASIRQRLKDQPGWHSGNAMLALIDLSSGKKDEAKQRLQELVENKERMSTMPAEACWVIGQELDQFEETRDLAMMMFENAVTVPSGSSMNQIQYSPVSKLVDSYIRVGRENDARELLLNQLNASRFDSYDEEYASYQRIENSKWVAEKMMKMQMPVDALRLYRGLLDTPERLALAGRWNGREADYYQSLARKGLNSALKAVTAENADRVVEELLNVRDDLRSGRSVLDLMLVVPEPGDLQEEHIRSSYIDLLSALSGEDEIADRIAGRIAILQQQHPRDLSIAVAAVTLNLKKQRADSSEAVERLLKLASDYTLDEIPAGRRPNSRQRREASQLIPLWLVARQCIGHDDLHDQGMKLSELCLVASKRQVGIKESSAILYDLGDLLLKAGHKQEAEACWSQLLDLATERPVRRKPESEPRTGLRLPHHSETLPDRGNPLPACVTQLADADCVTQGHAEGGSNTMSQKNGLLTRLVALGVMSVCWDFSTCGMALSQESVISIQDGVDAASEPGNSSSPSELIPPLTVSQFRMAIVVAKSAAGNGMPDLSRRAVRESLLGGFPVADPVLSEPNSSRRIIRPSTSNAVDPIELEVVSALKEILGLWKGDAYPASETYHLLKSIVLPENRPREIRLYVTASNISAAQVDSLAEPLVSAAYDSKQLDDLKSATSLRSEAGTSAIVLRCLIAIRQEDHPTVMDCLTGLTEQLQKGLSTSDQHLALLAALRAFDNRELKSSSFPILRQILQLELQASSSGNREPDPGGKLADLVNRHLAETGDQKSVSEYFENVMTARQPFYSRYSGNYGLYRQQQDLAQLAQRAAGLKMPGIALDYLGRATDFEVEEYGRPNMRTTLASLVRHVRRLPASDGYSAWHQWTMPVQGRNTLRVLFETTTPKIIPELFIDSKEQAATQVNERLLSNLAELVESGKRAGRLADLRQEVQKLAEQKAAYADILMALIMIAQEDTANGLPYIQGLQETFQDRMKAAPGQSRQQRPTSHGDYLVYQACLDSPQFVSVFEDQLPLFRKRLRDTSQHEMLQDINLDWARRVSAGSKPDLFAPGADFTHWTAANASESSGNLNPWWTAYENQILQLGGRGGSNLYFRYPLSGDFVISMECFEDAWAECDAGFGGVVVLGQNSGSQTTIRSVSGHETIHRPPAMKRSRPAYNHLTIEVRGSRDTDPGSIRYLLNKHLVYEEPFRPTSPWLLLNTEGSRVSAFRNIQIEGKVEIPKKVALVIGDQMDGWNCSVFGDSQPRKRLMAEMPKDENDSISYYQRDEPVEFSWNAADSTLTGRAIEGAADDQQSWIYYQRPLVSGESFEYEFYCVPGETVAHPTIGRIALLLQPDGVESHWIADSWDQSVNEVALDNSVFEPEIQRSSGQLALKENDWNRVRVHLLENVVNVFLNDTLICERSLEPEVGHRIGLFRYRRQSSKVRNLTLSGDWPDVLPAGEELLEVAAAETEDVNYPVAAILDDASIGPLAGEIVMASREMPSDKAFDYLADWVLPSVTHPNIRMHFVRMTSDPTHSESESRIICPAVELIRTARICGRIDELSSMLDNCQPTTPPQQNALTALKTLLAIESGRHELATQLLGEIWQVVRQPYPKGTSARGRQAEFVVASFAGHHPAYWAAGSDIARKLREYERNSENESHDQHFRETVHGLVGDIERYVRSLEASPVSKEQRSSQWSAVPYWKPEHRLSGRRPSTWSMTKGVAQHFPAETWSQLYFQSPLRGQFEITAYRTTHGHKEVSIGWGMHSAEPRYDLKAVRIARLMHSSRDKLGEVNLPRWDQQALFRIVVDGRTVKTFTNGVLVHEETLDGDPDPWLLLQTHSAANYAYVSNLRIQGQPEIPDEIDLIRIAGMSSWRADFFGEWFRTDEDSEDDTAPWRRVGDELIGQLDTNTSSSDRESLMIYQRPMLEDGVIEFETWYQPGEFEVHPSLGSSAFLLLPDGIRRHQITGAQHKWNDRLPDNQTPIEGATDDPGLIEGEWNRVRLVLKGDAVTISINGHEAATTTITDPPNERQFGLFRYSQGRKCRVRKLLYRGEWPKELPSIADQVLAAPDSTTPASGSVVMVDEDLSQPRETLQARQLILIGPEDRSETSSQGLHLHMHDTKRWQDNPGISFRQRIEGDCEMTITYQDAVITPQKNGWGVSLVFDAVLDDEQKTRVECNLGLDKNGQLRHNTQLLRNHPGQANHSLDQITYHPGTASGQLRLVRRGGQMDCFIRPDGEEAFHFLNSFAIGNAAIRQVNCGAKCSDDVASVNVILTHFTVRQASPQNDVVK
ncbi:MAG: DUF1583 domain-containing protein [Planctomycetaceae bacterium]|nr:DUF1583 domain-containing protein [Planctomycetaceae bacterium]